MFGLMRFRKTCGHSPESWKNWRLHYCGTCKVMGRVYGQASRLTLNHDTVFLGEMLTALSPKPVHWSAGMRSFSCMSLPASQAEAPEALRYAAAATVVLTEYKLRDRIEDDSRLRTFWTKARRWWSPRFRTACAELHGFGFDVKTLDRALSAQLGVERRGDPDPAGPTASAASMFYAHGAFLAKRPELRETLARLGAAFGSMIYWLDAWSDQDSDQRAGTYNAIVAMGLDRERAIAEIDRHAGEAIRAMRELGDSGLAAAFASRLRGNLDARLGRRLSTVCSSCVTPDKPATWASAWDRAETLAEGRAWPVLALVALCVFVFPEHGRVAESADECVSLSGNLMALSSVLAVAIGKRKRGGEGAASCCLTDVCCCEGAECCCEIGECGECCNCCECGSCCHC